MADDRLKKTITRAQHVQELLNDAELTDAWSAVEQQIRNMWAGSPADDIDGREALYHELHALKAVRKRLESAMKAGKLAEKELEHQKHGN